MSVHESFHQKSYERHKGHFDQYASGGSREARAKSWFSEDTVDAWRHLRMYRLADPLLRAHPGARWLTVGDGRFGKDAQYLASKGANVLPTDIADALLREAQEFGLIGAFKRENAEALSFGDGEFDFAFCKEAYHHFPRPMLALYEMLRVASNGVILIEPNDSLVSEGFWALLLRKLQSGICRMIGRPSSRHAFEESGNYVYGVSRREMEKVAVAIDCRAVAFKGISDAYFEGGSEERMADNGPVQRRVRKGIRMRDIMCELGLWDFRLLAVVIMKSEPSAALVDELQASGYEVRTLPKNPYID